jgi:hypothetical protein
VSSAATFPSPAALAILREGSFQDADPEGLNLSLRKQGHPAEVCIEVVNQVALRKKALQKLGPLAQSLLFTRQGLEQASRIEVARYHARRLNGLESVTDLTCGIGLDSFAFAESGLAVQAIDIDQVTAEFAKHNLAGFPEAAVQVGDARSTEVRSKSVFLDPARRDLKSAGRSRRLLQPSDFEPPIDFAFELLAKFPGGVKLSPGLPHELIDPRFEATWVSHDGDLVELSQWSIEGERAGKRYAVMVQGEGEIEFSGEVFEAEVAPLSEFIYEPDAALIRSHLIGELAQQLGLGPVSTGLAYLTGTEVASPWLRRFKVVEELPLQEKAIRHYLTQQDIGRLEIKKRGVDIEPELLRKRLKLRGSGAATLIATKVGGAHKALVCEQEG